MAEKKINILIVEDEKAVSKALELKLSHTGFNVEVANNGHEALNALEKKQYDLILLDLIMPEIDGFSVLEKIQKTENKKTAVIVTSNLGQNDDEEKAKLLGAKDYIVKSNTTLADIVARVENFLTHKK